MKSVKRLLSVLIVLLTCISLFAGGSAESTAGERTKITVLLNTGGNDETYRTWSQILDKFGEEHGLTIEYELIANKADYMNKLQLYISSDQLPDIYGCFNGPYSDAAKASGQLLNTQKELEELGLFDQYNMAVVDFLKDANDGQMYLMPQGFGIPDGPTAIRISFVMVAIWWAVFSLPLAFFVKEEKGDRVSLKEAVHDGFSQIASTLRSLRNLKNTAIFLVAYWCYIDGVDTIIRMATDYGTALGFPSESLIVALLITQFVAFPSAILYNILGKRIGVRRAILIAIGAYAVIAVIGFFMTDVSQFYILACCIGLFQGGIQALSRSYYTRLIPKENTSEFYGFFNMLGKFAAIIGPFLVGIVTLITGEQRYGIVSLVILFVLGFVLLRRVDEKKASEEIEAFSKR